MASLLQPTIGTARDPLDVTHPDLYRDDAWHAPFAELRARGGVHFHEHTRYGPMWSITTHRPIQHIESLPDVFSSEHGITIVDPPEGSISLPMFIAMDRPKHTGQRRTVAPAFTPSEMARLTENIRARTGEVLDALPIGQPFDWVDTVSIELTTQMLAILFDFPWAERRKLILWSDWASDIELVHSQERREERLGHLFECAAYFRNLWDAKIGKDATPDLISMMIRSDATAEMSDNEFLGNLILLIVGGNDTTRNSMTAFAYGLDLFPDERAKLEADPSLIHNATQEIIRWQTPLASMRRQALEDSEVEGQMIRAGVKIALWYLSANRDESVFYDGDTIIVDRPNARRHLAFGHGIHRCIGARLAELQISVLLEEIAKRRPRPNVIAAPEHVAQCFVHGYKSLPVELSRY